MIGARGGARSALRYFVEQGVATLAFVVRDSKKVAHFSAPGVEIHSLDECEQAFEGASAMVNASPLGMAGSPAMPAPLLNCVATHALGAALFDMVYEPLRMQFLEVGAANGGIAVDGQVMLVGQARSAFETFFGQPPPAADPALRDLLAI